MNLTDKDKILSKLIKECKNIGPASAQRMYQAGITSFEELKNIGTEEAFFKIWTSHPSEVCINACYLYALEGAITNTMWNKIPEKRKQELRTYTKKLRQSF